MIRDLRKILNSGEGIYVADYRYDEGIRIRDEFISPTLCANHDQRDIARMILIIEVVNDKSKRGDR